MPRPSILSAGDCIVSWLPLYHDMGFMTSLHMALARGVHSVLIEPLDWVSKPVLYLDAVSRFRATLGWHPNFAFAFMADSLDLSRDFSGRHRPVLAAGADELLRADDQAEPGPVRRGLRRFRSGTGRVPGLLRDG